jgi:putative lipoprotein
MINFTASVKGTITYRERMALTPNASVEIVLADVSMADAPYIQISKKVFSPAGQVPIPFELTYDPKQIMENHTYAVMAKIYEGNQLMFINDQSYLVITRGQRSEVQMLLKRVGNH